MNTRKRSLRGYAVMFGIAALCAAFAGPFQYCVWNQVTNHAGEVCKPGTPPLECGECYNVTYDDSSCNFNVYNDFATTLHGVYRGLNDGYASTNWYR